MAKTCNLSQVHIVALAFKLMPAGLITILIAVILGQFA